MTIETEGSTSRYGDKDTLTKPFFLKELNVKNTSKGSMIFYPYGSARKTGTSMAYNQGNSNINKQNLNSNNISGFTLEKISESSENQNRYPQQNQGINAFNRTYSKYLPRISIDEPSNIQPNLRPGSSYIKQEKISIENGITFTTNSNYKLYFYIPTMEIFYLKEVAKENAAEINSQLNLWNKSFKTNKQFTKALDNLINVPEGKITYVLESILGYSLKNYIQFCGFLPEYIIQKISSDYLDIIYKEKNNTLFNELKFCSCDIFIDYNEKIKLIPFALISEKESSKKCNCKYFYERLSNYLQKKIPNQFFLGFILLKIISGNFQLKSLETLNGLLEEKITKKLKFNCCLMHTLLDIEKILKKKEPNGIYLGDILKCYSPNLKNFICQCLSFDFNKNFTDLYLQKFIEEKYSSRSSLSVRELSKLIKKKNKITLKEFMNLFDLIFKGRLNINPTEYYNKLEGEQNILMFLSNFFDTDKEDLLRIVNDTICSSNKSLFLSNSKGIKNQMGL
ncbi:MAG: hypothetical protein MJ252_05295 [archaeon]|nr:hypothetical protein [archaeon]